MKRWMLMVIVMAAALAAGAPGTKADECAADHKTRVAANGECLVIQAYGEPAAKTSLVVFIHGDGSRGGASDYLYKLAESFGAPGVVAIGLIRPGYYDSANNSSSGFSYRREGDGYREEIIEAVAGAVTSLKDHYKASRVVLAGHSGGAAISGVILGKYAGLVDAVVLGACPCHVPDWRFMRRGRNTWHNSLSPHEFTEKVDSAAKVIALTGSDDSNTKPVIARNYVEGLRARGIDATFQEVAGASHNGVARSLEFLEAVRAALSGGA